MGKKVSINLKLTEKENLSQLCDFVMRVSVDKMYFSVGKYFINIVQIVLLKKITMIEKKNAVVLLLLFFGKFC